MREELKTRVVAALEELVERHLDDKYENGQAGSFEAEVDCVKEARKVKSLIRELKNE